MNFHEYKFFSNLKVYVADDKSLLAMKLSSARALSKDLEDSITLINKMNIKTEEELFELLENYFPKSKLTAQIYFFSKEAFSQAVLLRK